MGDLQVAYGPEKGREEGREEGGGGVTHVPRLNFTTCFVLFVAISYFICPMSLFQGHFYNN